MTSSCYYAFVVDRDTRNEKNVRWILDSGASSHMSPEETFFEGDYAEGICTVFGGNGEGNRATKKKDIKIHTGDIVVTLVDTLLVPGLVSNIISIPVLNREGYRVEFTGSTCKISKDRELMMLGKLNKGHYVLTATMIFDIKVNITNDELEYHQGIPKYPNNLIEPEDWNEVKTLPLEHQMVWIQAMNTEIDILEKARTWKTVDPDVVNRKIINPLPTRWIYKIKYNEKNEIANVRARLVVKGCNQRPGKEFLETFAPVVNHTTIRTVLAMAGKRKWQTKHCDVSSAFLYGELKEELYIKSPSGPWTDKCEDEILQLDKAMYGLRQAAKAWNDKIHDSLVKIGMKRSEGDPCLYYLKKDARQIFLIIHVDDLLMTYNDSNLMELVLKELQKEYKIKDLGEVSTYLGINIIRKNGQILLHQTPKILKLIDKMGLNQSHGSKTPMITGYNRGENESGSPQLKNNEKYQEILGSLMYLSNVSRPDITISTNLLGRSVSKPTQTNWEAMKRIVKYLKETVHLKLALNIDNKMEFKVYCDSDWGGDLKDRKSTSGAAFFIGGSLVGWFSRKQKCVALSSAEAEYVALSTCLQEVSWMNRLLTDLYENHELPIRVLSDSQSCIAMAQSSGMSGRARHIEMKYHYSMEMLNKNIITLEYCPTRDMTADTFTKPLEFDGFLRHRQSLGLTYD